MRASLFFFLGFAVAACSGNDISIGQNDSGNQGNDSATGNDGSNNGQDSGNPYDSGNQNDSGNPGKDGGTILDAGNDGCTGKVYSFQCGQGVCQGGDSQYCTPYPNQCGMTPLACKCNYNCMCLLANAPPCIQGSLKCQVGGTGALYLSCF